MYLYLHSIPRVSSDSSDSTDPDENGTGDLFEWLTGDGLNGGGK